jgi:hypothetical protein
VIGALARVTVWLTLSLNLIAGLFWALVSTPESNVWMLALSALLVVALLMSAGLAIDVAMRLWRGRPARPGGTTEFLWPGLRLVPALLLFSAVGWAAEALGAQVEASRGRISATLIARTGWANPEVIFTAARWLVALAAWVVAPLVGLGLFGALTHGTALSARGRWLRQALSWRALGAGTVVTVSMAWFWPWLDAWRPALPPTWVQLAFVGAKAVAGLAALALAVAGFIRLAALDPDRAHPGSAPPL